MAQSLAKKFAILRPSKTPIDQLRKNTLLSVFLVYMASVAFGQIQTITIGGIVKDEMDQPIPNVFVINKNSDTGGFGNTDGTFSIVCAKSDTVLIGAVGFMPRYITMHDSVFHFQYSVNVFLERKVQRLATVEIFAPRNLKEIQDEIQKLGYNKNDFMLSGINAAESPITFLYQQFSRTERSKRLVAELENGDRKRELLKELFRIYIDYDIIILSDDQFDLFIDFINVSDEFMKNCSQYDFLLYVKERFGDFRIWQRRQGLKDEEYQYDKD